MASLIRILLVDDHAVVRSGLRLLLETQEDLTVVGEARDGETALAHCRAVNPDLVLMDIGLPGLNGLESTRAILAERPDTQVLILTMHEDDGYFSEALAAGARGYVLKEAPPAELLAGIRAVAAGGGFFHPALARRLATGRTDAPGSAEPERRTQAGARLTQREREIMYLTAEGRGNREIGAMLYISARTVERHRSNLMAKLGLATRIDLIRYALEHDVRNVKP